MNFNFKNDLTFISTNKVKSGCKNESFSLKKKIHLYISAIKCDILFNIVPYSVLSVMVLICVALLIYIIYP